MHLWMKLHYVLHRGVHYIVVLCGYVHFPTPLGHFVVVVPSALVFKLAVTVIGRRAYCRDYCAHYPLLRIWYLGLVNFQGSKCIYFMSITTSLPRTRCAH